MATTSKKPTNKQQEDVTGFLLMGATAIAMILGLRNKKTQAANTALVQSNIVANARSNAPLKNVSRPTKQSGFPLRIGSKGEDVRMLQQILLNRGGASAKAIKNSGGVDGIFGRGTASALVAAGFPQTVSADLFNKIKNELKKVGIKKDWSSIDTYVFVDNFLGQTIYKDMRQVGFEMQPANPIINRLPDKTFLGRATGRNAGDYIEVRTTINNTPVAFWINRNNIETFTGNAMDFDSFRRQRREKNSRHKTTIVAQYI